MSSLVHKSKAPFSNLIQALKGADDNRSLGRMGRRPLGRRRLLSTRHGVRRKRKRGRSGEEGGAAKLREGAARAEGDYMFDSPSRLLYGYSRGGVSMR